MGLGRKIKTIELKIKKTIIDSLIIRISSKRISNLIRNFVKSNSRKS